jgi:hypothetical protein
MLATKTHTTMRGHRVCSEHHWADNKDTDCRGCVWEYERAARNIAFALGLVAAVMAGDAVGPKYMLTDAGLWKARGE